MISRFLAVLVLVGTTFAQAATPPSAPTVEVWPEGKMPGKGANAPEAEVPRNDGFHRITMIVCPGGGYGYTVIDKEGTEIAAWLNSAGFSALVLKYRTPNNRAGALQDAQRALSLARERAAEWNIDPQRLGIIGFSAGGHLAAMASVPAEARSYPPIDEIDRQSCRPDFAVLVYPAYLSGKDVQAAQEAKLLAAFPPTFIVHTEDDKGFVPGSRAYAAALTAAKVPHEFALYPSGGHGYGLHCKGDARAWPDDTLRWLQKVLPTLGK